MILRLRFSFIGLLVTLFSATVQAGEALDFSIHQDYTSTRALGMGNAFTAVVDDHSAIFYNPAALALREDGVIRGFLRAGIGAGYLDLIDDIESTSDNSDPANEQDEMFDLIQSKFGENYYSRLPTLGGVWARPNWSVAFIPVDLSVDIGVHQQIGPALSVTAYQDSTLAYGYGKEFNWLGENHKFAMGATVKALHRIYFSDAVSAGELANESDPFQVSRAQEGLTFDIDIGTLWQPQNFMKFAKPTFSAVLRNALDYGFPINLNVIDEDSDEPPKLVRRLDLGSKFDLPNFWVFDPHVALDIKDIGHPNWSYLKSLHVGAEMYWQLYKWWKGSWAVGLNQGYLTAGLGARLAWFQIDLATWGEEVGTTSAPQESRRYMLELSLEF